LSCLDDSTNRRGVERTGEPAPRWLARFGGRNRGDRTWPRVSRCGRPSCGRRCWGLCRCRTSRCSNGCELRRGGFGSWCPMGGGFAPSMLEPSRNPAPPAPTGDIILADRGYCHRQGVDHVLQCHGDAIVRFSRGSFEHLGGPPNQETGTYAIEHGNGSRIVQDRAGLTGPPSEFGGPGQRPAARALHAPRRILGWSGTSEHVH